LWVEARRFIIAAMSETVLLDTVLRPAPPLPPRALLLILAAVTSINLAFALYFISHGAWPVMPFMGLDEALLAWAFRASLRAARHEEHVLLTPKVLQIMKRPPDRKPSETVLNPYWVRVQLEEPAGRSSQLTLWSHGRGIRIGAFLPPMERASFAERLKAALHRARTAL
jgi:uncharacterized membrane protein